MASTLSCQSCSKPFSKPFSDPRLLPCLHVFCKGCLEPLYSQDEGTITCPACNKTSSCKPPAELPRQLRVVRDSTLSKIQKNPQESLCGSCDENNKAVAYCEDCSTPICSDCKSSHKRLRAVKRHSLVSLTESQPIADEEVSCILHPEEAVKYYCSTCSCLVCSECLFAHKEHECGRIDNAELLKKEKDELQSVMFEVEKAITPIVKTTEKISGIVKRVQVNKDRAKEDIDKTFHLISVAMEKRRLELTQEIENSAVAKSTLLVEQKEDLDKVSTSLQLALESGSAACKEYSSAEILAVKGTVLQASKGLLEESRSLDLQPVCNSNLSVAIYSTEMIKSISSLGNIIMGFLHPPFCGLIGINPQLAIGVAKGSECVVILQTRDAKGEDLTEGGAAKVLAKVTNQSLGLDSRKCAVTDLDNGRYAIRFSNPTKGEHKLIITVDDVDVSNCPFTINVRDYTTIATPVASIITQGSPAYIDMGPDNQQYITFNGGSVEVYNTAGEKVNEMPQSKFGNKPLRGIAVDKKKRALYVATAGTHQIVKTDLDGAIIDAIGMKGNGELEFNSPMGLRLTRDGLLLVAEDTNKRIQVLTSDLSFVRFIPCLSNVYGVSVDNDGNVHAVVTDRVEVFSITGEKITEYGEGVLTRAGDIAFLGASSLKSPYCFVSDHVTEGKVYMFQWATNTLVHSFAMGRRPLGLAIDQEGTIIVADWNDKKLHRF